MPSSSAGLACNLAPDLRPLARPRRYSSQPPQASKSPATPAPAPTPAAAPVERPPPEDAADVVELVAGPLVAGPLVAWFVLAAELVLLLPVCAVLVEPCRKVLELCRLHDLTQKGEGGER